MNLMQIANVRLRLNELGSDVALEDITPAEAALLNTDHATNAKGEAIHDIVVTGEVTRSNEAEINRLREKYVNAKDRKGEPLAEKLYPGKNPTLPQTFKDAGFAVEAKPSAASVAPATTVAATTTK
jgi:hypothetical protein